MPAAPSRETRSRGFRFVAQPALLVKLLLAAQLSEIGLTLEILAVELEPGLAHGCTRTDGLLPDHA
jgi:hypothetical protein